MTRRIFGCFLLIALIFFSGASYTGEISQVPLFISTKGIDPNVMFILDDSLSMKYSYVPDSIGSDSSKKYAKSSSKNTLYYDPNVTYLPPMKADGSGDLGNSTFNAAWKDGYSLDTAGNHTSATVNLNNGFKPTWSNDSNYANDGSDASNQRAYYYQFDATNVNCDGSDTDEDCYDKIQIGTDASVDQKTNFANWYSYYRSRLNATKASASRAFAAQNARMRLGYGSINETADYEGVKPFTESVTQFKPWRDGCDGVRVSRSYWNFNACYRFYADVGLTRTQANTENDPYNGYDSCWSYSERSDPDCYVFRPLRDNCDGTEADPDCSVSFNYRKDFFDWLYALEATGFTPLRNALDAAGQYYSGNTPWLSDPDDSSSEILTCRQSYTILMTDGYWNSSQASTSGARANNDGANGSAITGPDGQSFTYTAVSPFTDAYSNTLADVAMYYWKRDLLTSVDNRVPTNDRDPAFWQHMVTFGVGLGVPTQIDPDEAFNAIDTGATINWPDPYSVGFIPLPYNDFNPPPTRIDDLLHASVNGHGGFFNAQNSEEFIVRLQNLLTEIVGREESSATAVATNSTRLGTGSALYEARFNTDGWTGHFVATALNANGTLGDELWNTDNIDTAFPTPRKVYTLAGGNKIDFLWPQLTDDQKASLIGTDDETLGQERLNWLRGDRSNEKPNGVLRKRTALLGDIVNSNPLLVEQDAMSMLYVGANDGMLHAFNAATGVEQFAFIPQAMFSNLATLTNVNYTEHRYFVDGSPQKFEVDDKSYLIVSTGAGGQSVFALDITDQASFTKDKVLWEFTNVDNPTTSIVDGDPDLGYTIGQASIGKLQDGTVVAVFGNGYQSASGKAALFVVKMENGELLRKIPTDDAVDNGLAPPALLIKEDTEGNLYIGAAYAGDLKGKLWKFDLEAGESDLLFEARDDNGVAQPITATPDVGRHEESGYLVIFGTGKYFETGDHNGLAPDQNCQTLVDNGIRTGEGEEACPPPVQSLYGLWDKEDGSAIAGRAFLQEQTFIEERVAGNNFRAMSKNPLDWDTQLGWYVDLTPDGDYTDAIGERVTVKPILGLGRAIFTTRIPYTPSDPCLPASGTSWVMVVDMMTGGQVLKPNPLDPENPQIVPLFDINRDTVFDEYDFIELPSGEWVSATGFQTQEAGLASGVTLLEIENADGSTRFDLIFSGSEKLTTTATSEEQRGESDARAASGAASAAVAAAQGDTGAAAVAAASAAGASDETAQAAGAAAATAISGGGDAAAAAQAARDAGASEAAAQAAAAAAVAAATVAAGGDATAGAAAAARAAAADSEAVTAIERALSSGGDTTSILRELKKEAALLQGDEGVGVRLFGEAATPPSPIGGRRSWRQLL